MSNHLENSFYEDIRAILRNARAKAYRSVNSVMVEAYWRIGKRIVEEEQDGQKRAAYGDGVIRTLAKVLGNELGKGFSIANLENFRKFYLTLPDKEIPYALRRELSWTHHRLIMRVENPDARAYYLKECEENHWSTRVLERNLNSLYYERLLSTQKQSQAPDIGAVLGNSKLNDFIKDPYVLEFLGLPESPDYLETKLEHAIINNLQKFLLEMGKGFSFVGRQFRISSETSHFYIDLVFYNYLLKCFVVVDLKTTKLTHQDIGQMDMYVRMFDDLKRGADDNPTIGLILCTDKDDTVVHYSVLKDNKQLFASKYLTILPTEKELADEIARERRLIEEQVLNSDVQNA